jgi:hypothetical protein
MPKTTTNSNIKLNRNFSIYSGDILSARKDNTNLNCDDEERPD